MARLVNAAPAIKAMEQDEEECVRLAAVPTLGKLEPATLDARLTAVLAKLDGSAWTTRRAALVALGELPPAAVKPHVAAIRAKLEQDSERDVCIAAQATLEKLGEEHE